VHDICIMVETNRRIPVRKNRGWKNIASW
jgi:hypothetical protein